MAKRQYRSYSRQFKLALVQDFLASGLNSSAFSRKCGVPYATIDTWVMRFKAYGEAGIRSTDVGRKIAGVTNRKATTGKTYTTKYAALDARLKVVESALKIDAELDNNVAYFKKGN